MPRKIAPYKPEVPRYKYPNKREGEWCVYFAQCRDCSLYCGMTIDIDHRIDSHNGYNTTGAKATAGPNKRPCRLVFIQYCGHGPEGKSKALRTEHYYKGLMRSQKVRLIMEQPDSVLAASFDNSKKSKK